MIFALFQNLEWDEFFPHLHFLEKEKFPAPMSHGTISMRIHIFNTNCHSYLSFNRAFKVIHNLYMLLEERLVDIYMYIY